MYYPFSYMFRAPAMLLPHESTVAHEQRFIMDAPMISRTRSRQHPLLGENVQTLEEIEIKSKDALLVDELQKLEVNIAMVRIINLNERVNLLETFQVDDEGATVPHTRPATPRSVTHNHDEDCSDDESDPNNKSESDH